jgi:hypothetical protein
MKYIILALLLLSHTVYATSVVEKTLPELVADSDHVVIGTVTAVKMHTWFGLETTNPKSRTGPGEINELRWTVAIAPSDILYSTKKNRPQTDYHPAMAEVAHGSGRLQKPRREHLHLFVERRRHALRLPR